MKFKQMMDMNMVPEWRDQYLDYQGLDSALAKAIGAKGFKSREKGIDLYYELIKSNQKFSQQFINECRVQLNKINTFHHEKLDEMRGKYNNLHDQLDQVLSSAIYREVQPELSIGSRHNLNARPSVCSITELFKNFRNRISQTEAPKISVTIADNGPTYLASSRQARLSISSLISDSLNSSSIESSREQICLYKRKLSEGFNSCKQRLAITMIPNISSNTKLNKLNTIIPISNNYQATEDGSSRLPNREELRRSSANSLRQQTLAGATSQPKKTLIAFYKKKIRNLKFAFRELYLNLVLLEQYTQLNHNGFEQILRKHDRMFASTMGRNFYQDLVQTAEFHVTLPAIDQMIEGVEHTYTLHFENGNRRKAIEKLQVPSNVYKPISPMLDFRVGYEMGTFAVLFILVVMVGLLIRTGYDWRTVFRLYRSPLLLIIFLFQAGISIVIWKHFKINHVLIFELDPRDNLSFQHFFEFASLLGIIWSISVLLFLFSERLGIGPSMCPLVVVVIVGAFLFNPTATCHHRARFWFLRILVSDLVTNKIPYLVHSLTQISSPGKDLYSTSKSGQVCRFLDC